MIKEVNIAFFLFLLFCSGCKVKPRGEFDPGLSPAAPDYSQEKYWAALPFTKDQADLTSSPYFKDRQSEASVDVFFLHPTTYTGDNGQKRWNGPVDNKKLNKKTDESPIKYQATIFNGVGKIYAPRYRQAHLGAYFSDKKESAKKAFALAYGDVKAAFEYYLEHYNQGRPIIIACHSQGTTHGKRLLKEFFDGQDLKDQLVAAYLVGIQVKEDEFETIPPCQNETQTQCFCSWRTYKKNFYPKSYVKNNNILVTNPLIWTTDSTYAPDSLNKGAVLRNFDEVLPGVTDAQVEDGLLWAKKPKFPGSFFFVIRNYHIGDYNLYYTNVRENAQKRTSAFLKTNFLNLGSQPSN